MDRTSGTNSTLRLRRVVALLNAISDLREGDLRSVLNLDGSVPIFEVGLNDTFQLGDDGKIVLERGWPPPEKSLRNRVQTGEFLGRILEHHLLSVLIYGEAALPSYKKRRRAAGEIGGTAFGPIE
jgi:hypothetical protein